MEKSKKGQPALVISKSLGEGCEKILFKFTALDTIKTILCFVFQFSKIFSGFSPFGTAFYSAVFQNNRWPVNFFASLSGMIISQREAFWSYAVTLVSQTVIFALFDEKMKRAFPKALTSSLAFFGFGFLRLVSSDYIIYDVFALGLEAVLLGASTMIFSSFVTTLGTIKRRSRLSEAEMLCFYTSVAIIVMSLQNSGISGAFRLSSVISVLMILVVSHSSSMGTALGIAVLLGTVNALGQSTSYGVMATYPLAALISSAMNGYGKTGVILGFVIANTASSLFLAQSSEVVVGIYDCFVASLVFALFPQRFINMVARFNDKLSLMYEVGSKRESGCVKASTEGFERICESIKDLSELYRDINTERKLSPGYISMMTTELENRVCKGCKNKEKCFNKTDGIACKTFNKLLSRPGGCPVLGIEGLPEDFKAVCHRQSSFVQTYNHFADIIKTESKWLSKTTETRKLVSRQLSGISQILKKECEIAGQSGDKKLEDKLWLELDKLEIVPSEICVKKNRDGDVDVDISLKDDKVSKETRGLINECISNACRGFLGFSGVRRRGNSIVFSYSPKTAYKATFGYATRSKTGESVCGDSFNVVYSEKNKIIMVLSDGMGSGKTAGKESKMTVELLEKFLVSGFDCDTAVELINSSLLMQGGRESFATMDICSINLASSTLEFTKFGASDAYIKSDGEVKCIKGSGLPVGILRDAKAKKHMLSLEGDTVVVLMSDGVGDVALRDSKCDGWIQNTLMNLSTSNPQVIAAKLLERATALQKGKACDDMTVLVSYIAKASRSKHN